MPHDNDDEQPDDVVVLERSGERWHVVDKTLTVTADGLIEEACREYELELDAEQLALLKRFYEKGLADGKLFVTSTSVPRKHHGHELVRSAL